MRHWLLAIPFLFLSDDSVSGQKLKVVHEPENIVAIRLEGTWEFAPELTKKLQGSRGARLRSFKLDPNVLKNAKLRPEVEQLLSKEPIYAAGHLTENNEAEKYPFVLTCRKGMPYVFYFLPVGGDPFGNPESFYVFVAAGRDRKSDLLWVGGDTPDEAFSAFQRTETPSAPVAPQRPDDKRSDREKLQGSWKVVSAKYRFLDIAKGLLNQVVKIEGDTLRISNGNNQEEMHFALGPTKTPKEIDLYPDREKQKLPLLGIYAFEQDDLKLCWSKTDGKDRPTMFDLEAGKRHVSLILRRVK